MAKHNSSNPIQLGANMSEMAYKHKAALPNEHDVEAQSFADIGKKFSAPGDRPRGIWRNIGAGAARGLETGAKLKSVDKKKGDYDKFEATMNYFQEANNAAVERNEWFEKREQARKEYMPQIIAYADNIDKLDPQSQRIMASGMLEGYGKAIGEDFKLSSIDGSNPFLMTIESSKGQQLFDVRSLFAGDEVMQQQLAMKMPEYQLKLQEERQNKAKELAIKQQEADFKYPMKDSSQGMPEEETITFGDHSYKVGSLQAAEKNARAEYQKKVYKDIDSIPKNNQAIKAIESMEEVFDRNPNIGTNMINMLDNPDGVDSWWNITGRKLSGQDLTDMEILRKATNDLNLDTILGISGKSATDMLKKAVQAASPSGKLTKGGFDNVSAKWKAKAFEANELAQAKYEALQQGKSLVPTAYKGKAAQSAKQGSVQGNDDNQFDLSDLGANQIR